MLEQHGGLEGFLEYIKKQEQEHPERLVDPKQVKDIKTIELHCDEWRAGQRLNRLAHSSIMTISEI